MKGNLIFFKFLKGFLLSVGIFVGLLRIKQNLFATTTISIIIFILFIRIYQQFKKEQKKMFFKNHAKTSFNLGLVTGYCSMWIIFALYNLIIWKGFKVKKKIINFLKELLDAFDDLLLNIGGFVLSFITTLYFLGSWNLNIFPHVQISGLAMLFLALLILYCIIEIRVVSNLDIYLGESKKNLEKRYKKRRKKLQLVYGLITGSVLLLSI